MASIYHDICLVVDITQVHVHIVHHYLVADHAEHA